MRDGEHNGLPCIWLGATKDQCHLVYDFVGCYQQRINQHVRNAEDYHAASEFGSATDFRRVVEDNEKENVPRARLDLLNMRRLRGKHKGAPVVIVAPGPGMKAAVKDLAAVKAQGAIVIAINRAVLFEPVAELTDYFITSDRHSPAEWATSTLLRNPTLERNATTLVMAINGNRELARQFTDDRIAWFWNEFSPQYAKELCARIGLLESGATTAFNAIHFAEILGAGRVMLCGIEFSWSADQHYFDQTLDDSFYRERMKVGQMMMRSPWGEMEQTQVEMVTCAEHVEAACEVIERAGHPVFNCCLRGLVETRRQMPLLAAMAYDLEAEAVAIVEADRQDAALQPDLG